MFPLWSHGFSVFPPDFCLVCAYEGGEMISLFNSGILGSCGVFCLSSFCVLFCCGWVVVGVCLCCESCLLVCVSCLLGKVCW